METSQEANKILVEPEPSQSSSVDATSEPPVISPKKPIQLGIVQSSVGIRGTASSPSKKSRWDQGPGPGEVEGESSQPDLSSSQANENFSSVKDLVKKFEGISGSSSSTSLESDKDEVKEKEECSQQSVSPTPTRVKLVRTNFLKAEKPEEPAKDMNTSQVSDSLSQKSETTVEVETNTEKNKDKSEVSDLNLVTKSKALQIISCNYDSESDESSQGDESSSAPDSKTPFDNASTEKLSDVHISLKCKENVENVCSLNNAGAKEETETLIDIDDNNQKEISSENPEQTPISVIVNKIADGKPSQNESYDEKYEDNDLKLLTKENSKNTSYVTKSENKVFDLNSDKLESVNKVMIEKEIIEKDSLGSSSSEIASGTITSNDLKNPVKIYEEQQLAKTMMMNQDNMKLNETNTKNVENNTADELDWVIVTHKDVEEIMSEDYKKSKGLDVSTDLKTLNVLTSGEVKTSTSSKTSGNVSISGSEETSNSTLEDKKFVSSSIQNDTVEALCTETNVLDGNIKSIDEDFQTNDNLKESSAKHGDKVDETMEEIFSENLGSYSVPKMFEKESNDGETNTIELEKTNQEGIYFEGMIETDEKENSIEQNKILGSQETNETLLEMLESDNAPRTSAVNDIVLSINNLTSVNTGEKDSSLEDEQLEHSASSEICVAKIAIGETVSVIKDSSEPAVVKSMACELTESVNESSSIDKTICHSKETVGRNLEEVKSDHEVKEISSAEKVESHHIVVKETLSDKEISCKDVTISEPITVSEVNKLDDKITQGKYVEEIDNELIETELSVFEEEKVPTLLDFSKEDHFKVQEFEKENISTKETVAEGEKLETNKATGVICTKSNPSTVAEKYSELEANEINNTIKKDSDNSEEKIKINDLPTEVAHTSKVKQIVSKDQMDEKKNTISIDSAESNSKTKTLINYFPVEVAHELQTEIGENSGILSDSPKACSLTDSKFMVDNTEDVLKEEIKNECTKEHPIEDVATTSLVTDKVKSKEFVDTIERKVTDTAQTSKKLEDVDQVDVSSVYCASKSNDMEFSSEPEILKNNESSYLDYSTESSMNLKVASEEKSIYFTKTEKPTCLNIENEPSKQNNKTENKERDTQKEPTKQLGTYKEELDKQSLLSSEAKKDTESSINNDNTSKKSDKTGTKPIKIICEKESISITFDKSKIENLKANRKQVACVSYPDSSEPVTATAIDSDLKKKKLTTEPVTEKAIDSDHKQTKSATELETVKAIDNSLKQMKSATEPETVEAIDSVLKQTKTETVVAIESMLKQTKSATEPQTVEAIDSVLKQTQSATEPETVEAIDSFLKQTKPETVKAIGSILKQTKAAKEPETVEAIDSVLKQTKPAKKPETVEAIDNVLEQTQSATEPETVEATDSVLKHTKTETVVAIESMLKQTKSATEPQTVEAIDSVLKQTQSATDPETVESIDSVLKQTQSATEPETVEAIDSFLKQTKPETVKAIGSILKQTKATKEPETVEAIDIGLKQTKPAKTPETVEAIDSVLKQTQAATEPETVESIDSFLKQTKPETVEDIGSILKQTKAAKEPETVEAIDSVLKQTQSATQPETVEAIDTGLKQTKPAKVPETVEAIDSVLKQTKPTKKPETVESIDSFLKQTKPETVEAIGSILKQTKAATKPKTVEAIDSVLKQTQSATEPETVESIDRFLKQTKPETVEAIAISLKQTKPAKEPEAVAAIDIGLKQTKPTKEPETVEAIAISLKQTKPAKEPEAVAAIDSVLKQTKPATDPETEVAIDSVLNQTKPAKKPETVEAIDSVFKQTQSATEPETVEAIDSVLKQTQSATEPETVEAIDSVLKQTKPVTDPETVVAIDSVLNQTKPAKEPATVAAIDSVLKQTKPATDPETEVAIDSVLNQTKPAKEPETVEAIDSVFKQTQSATEPETVEAIDSVLKQTQSATEPETVEAIESILKQTKPAKEPETVEAIDSVLKQTKSGTKPEVVDVIDSVLKQTKSGTKPEVVEAIDSVLKQTKPATDPETVVAIDSVLNQTKPAKEPETVEAIDSVLKQTKPATDPETVVAIDSVLNQTKPAKEPETVEAIDSVLKQTKPAPEPKTVESIDSFLKQTKSGTKPEVVDVIDSVLKQTKSAKEPETVEAIDSFLKQSKSPKEADKVGDSSTVISNSSKTSTGSLCEPEEKSISEVNVSDVKANNKNVVCEVAKKPNIVSLKTSSNLPKATLKEGNNETASDNQKSEDVKTSLKLNIAKILAASPDVSKLRGVKTSEDKAKSVEPLKLKLKKTDYEVYSPKRSESPVESSKAVKTITGNKPADKTKSVGTSNLEKDKELKKITSGSLLNEPKPIEKSLKVEVSNENSDTEKVLSNPVIDTEESTTCKNSKPSVVISDTNTDCTSKKKPTKKDVVKSTLALTSEEMSLKSDKVKIVVKDNEKLTLVEHQTKRSADSIMDSCSDSPSLKKKLKRSQTELNVKEKREPLKEDQEKEEIATDLSPVPSQTISPSQASESDAKQSPKTTSKDVPPPVRVSARQKQRQAVAAALAAEEKAKEVKPSVENVPKKAASIEKAVDKKGKKSISPIKDVGMKALFVKTTETAKQPLNTSEKSPKLLVESKSPSPVSPKKVVKELGQEKLEPITLKLSKEDNPVIIRSSSLSPKKVLSPQSPQQKSLGFTLKIGKDSATIVPKDPSHSPKLKETSPSASSSKADLANKVGYLIKDTGLTITPVSSPETQEQKLNKITLKLSKAGGHPEIKQEKAETWKAIKKLGDVDIVSMEGKVSAESSKRKEKSNQGSAEKKMKVGDLTIEPSTSSGLSKLQGLLTQAPLNNAESSEDIQFVGFGSPVETPKTVEKVQYDIGLVKPEDELSLPKKRGRPRKITSPSEMVHSVTHSGLAGSKSILAASLQHQTMPQHLHQQQHLQVQESMMAPQEDADSSIPMFPVPLFDLSDDTFMEPHPTIFPEQVQPDAIIMRSARGRPIGRSRRPRGSGLSRGERGGPRGRPRGSRGIKKILEEMEFLSYPDMEQPITLDNIDAEIPRILEPPVSHITEKTMALLRKSIECKKESLEKKRRSDGSDSDNKDTELDAKVKEMKEKIEAAYKAELESPGKEEKEATKKTPEKAEIKEVSKKSPEPSPSSSSDAVVKTGNDSKSSKRKSTEESAPFHGIGKEISKRKLSEEKVPEKRAKRKSTDETSGSMGKDKIESKKLKTSTTPDDQKQVKRKSIEEKPEIVEIIENKQDVESSKPKEITDKLLDCPNVEEGKEDSEVQVIEEMEVDKPATEETVEGEKQAEAEPETPAKPVKPKPRSKAEIKRIKREKDRLRREAKKLAALEALKAPPPNPSEEDTRMSASDVNGDGIDEFGFKKNRMEVGDAEGKEFCVEYIAEYQWPLQGGELYMIQEQISTYLAVKSFKRKYPDIKRRPVEMEERTYLCDSGLVSESMCDLGLTAVSSSEVLDIMFQDFPEQYEELRKNMRDKAARELINKQKEKKKFEQSLSKSDLKEHAIQSAQSWNQALNRSRNESRRCHLDLQTWTVQYPRSRGAKMTRPTPKLGNYPLALIPGQYSDYCKRYTPQELRYWPINTVLYGPLQPNERNSTGGGSDGSQSESEDSSSSDDTSDSSSDGEGTEEEERDCKVCGGGRKGGTPTVRCSQCAHHIHTSCADLKPVMLVHLRKYPWQCSSCKTCQKCNDSKNESKMLFCDLCDRGYHSYCVGLRRVPAGSWACQLCTHT